MAAVKTPTCSPRLPHSLAPLQTSVYFELTSFIIHDITAYIFHILETPPWPPEEELTWVVLARSEHSKKDIGWTQSGTRADLKWRVKSSFI